ncbi:MAG: transglutaminase domain-containing protein [Hungatella sp.]|nr:transglutaminase domain-containing protein [Hungatella sp.]
MRKKRWTLLLSAMAAILILGTGACAKTAPDAGQIEKGMELKTESESRNETKEPLADIDDNMVCLNSSPQKTQVRVPVASGTVTYGNDMVSVDASNVRNGYVMVKYTGSVKKIKVQISKGSLTYTYDLNARDAYEVFPMSEGNGTYTMKVFENVRGNQYSQAFSQDVSVTLADEFEPFLYPNQYVNFSQGSTAVQKGIQLASGAEDDFGVVEAVYNYVVDNLTYDTAKAASVQSGYLPDVDKVLAEGKGICFDYAALMVSMLRSQDIPAKLVVGYTGSAYHAWVNVYIDGVGWIDNYIYFDGTNWSLADPTFASTGGQSDAIKQYIGDGANYQQKYCY